MSHLFTVFSNTRITGHQIKVQVQNKEGGGVSCSVQQTSLCFAKDFVYTGNLNKLKEKLDKQLEERSTVGLPTRQMKFQEIEQNRKQSEAERVLRGKQHTRLPWFYFFLSIYLWTRLETKQDGQIVHLNHILHFNAILPLNSFFELQME